MAYDHRLKAGNQGDVVKHVALLAVVRSCLGGTSRLLNYVDAFAGPAGSLLLPGGEWGRGVGRLNRAAAVESPHVGSWIRWYLARPQLTGSRYPGSALVVSDAAVEAGMPVSMTLWDISEAVVADLRAVFPKQTVLHRPVDPAHPSVNNADLLFVDPPGLAEQWPLVLELLQRGRTMLAWLPINVAIVNRKVRLSSLAEEQLDAVRHLAATAATRVLWAHGGRTIGCLLVYRCAPAAVANLRQAVTQVVSLCAWPRQEIEHFGRF